MPKHRWQRPGVSGASSAWGCAPSSVVWGPNVGFLQLPGKPRLSCWSAKGEFQGALVNLAGSPLRQEREGMIQWDSGLDAAWGIPLLWAGCWLGFSPSPGVSFPRIGSVVRLPSEVMGPEGRWQGHSHGKVQVFPWKAPRPGRKDLAVPVGLIPMRVALGRQV